MRMREWEMLIDIVIDALIDIAMTAILSYAVFTMLMRVPSIRKMVNYIWQNRKEIIQKLKGMLSH